MQLTADMNQHYSTIKHSGVLYKQKDKKAKRERNVRNMSTVNNHGGEEESE
jgi:hypothetical protein